MDAVDLFHRASAELRRCVPFQSAVWTAADPETGLITAPMVVENLGSGEDCAAYWESELLEENVVPFRELARTPVPAAGLRAATGDLPARSARFRRLLLGQGVHDELRAVLRISDRPWGLVSLFRTTEAFRPDEITLLAGLSRPLAARLRGFARPPRSVPRTDSPAPGLILFDASGEAVSVNDEARQHLAALPDGPSFPSPLGLRLPIWVIGTALQARAVADGRDHSGNTRVRIRTSDGRWLNCHASSLTGPGGRPGPVALVIEPATPADLAVLVAEAYGLTPGNSRSPSSSHAARPPPRSPPRCSSPRTPSGTTSRPSSPRPASPAGARWWPACSRSTTGPPCRNRDASSTPAGPATRVRTPHI
ncbi:hypothetical protein GCM10020295_75850 [Streptomyces cinereospinus]